jgi:hypothetical protein
MNYSKKHELLVENMNYFMNYFGKHELLRKTRITL